MDRVLTDKIVVAKESYRCDASDRWHAGGYTIADCETAEQRLMVEAAEADGWKILPGQAYRKVVYIWEGRLSVYRARPGMDTMCDELGLWA